jgi:hypothetical protein
MDLFAGVLSAEKKKLPEERQDSLDVTSRTTVLYAGKQHFETETKTLTECVAVSNRGNESLRVPLRLEVRDLESPLGISILNATNGKTGIGAVWDISSAVTGSEVPPRSRTNPYCLSFHLDLPERKRKPDEIGSLLTLKLGVFARK